MQRPEAAAPVSLAVKATLLYCALFTLLTGASVVPALPSIRQAFADEPNAELLTKLVLSVCPLFIALGGPLWGRVSDRFGRKPVLIGCVIATAVFGLAGALVQGLWPLIFTRALVGLAVSGVTNACYTLTIEQFSGTERNRFVGLQAGVQKIGGLVFLVTGGILAAINWRLTFAVDLIALLVLPGAIFAIKEPRRRVAERRADSFVPDLPVVVVVWIAGFLGQAVFYMIPTQLPFLLASQGMTAPKLIGMVIAVSTLFSAVGATLYHRVRARLSYPAVFVLIGLLSGISFLTIAMADSIAALAAALAVSGLGFGLLLPNMTVWIVEGVPEDSRGRLIGIMMTAVFLGQFFSPLLMQPLVAAFGVSGAFAFGGGALLAMALGVAVWAAVSPLAGAA